MTTPQGVCGATVLESFKLNELTTSRTIDLPVSFMVWHGLLTRGDPNGAAKDGFVIPNAVVGNPTEDNGLMSTIFKGADAVKMDLLEMVRNPTEERLWNFFTAALKQLDTPLDNTVSEVALQAMLELFIRHCGGVGVVAEGAAGPGQRFDLLLTAHVDQKVVALLVEFKRLRPGNGKPQGEKGERVNDLVDLPYIAAPDCKTARAVLINAKIAEAKQWFHKTGCLTVGSLEGKAMRQCRDYKASLLAANPNRIVRCATAIHATVAQGYKQNTTYSSAFLVSVEPYAK
jgi:hypothetical protein